MLFVSSKEEERKKKLLLQLLNDLSSQVSERKAIGLVYAGWIFIRSSTRGCSLRENKGRHGNALVGDLRFISVTVNLSILIPFFAFFSLSRRWMSSHDSFHAFSTTLNQTSSLQGQSVPFFYYFQMPGTFIYSDLDETKQIYTVYTARLHHQGRLRHTVNNNQRRWNTQQEEYTKGYICSSRDQNVRRVILNYSRLTRLCASVTSASF